MNGRIHRSNRATLLAGLALALVLCPAFTAQAQTLERPKLLERFGVDIAYELSRVRGVNTPVVYTSDPETGRESCAFMFAPYRSWSQGLGIDVSFRFNPWLSAGTDLHLQQDFTPLTHPWFEREGIRFGRRIAFTMGVFAELRPLQRDYRLRSGLFLRAGLRGIWFDRHLTREKGIITSTNGYYSDVQSSMGGGYRLALTSMLSAHVMLDLSVGLANSIEWRLRVGGGFR